MRGMFKGPRLRTSLAAPLVHCGLFALFWALTWNREEPLPGNPAIWIYCLICVVDFPISAIVSAIAWFSDLRPTVYWCLFFAAWKWMVDLLGPSD